MFKEYKINDFLTTYSPTIDFHINELEQMPPLPPHIISPHKHLFHEVFFIKKGNMIHNIDFKEYTIKQKSIFFISQYQLHLLAKTEQSVEGYRLMFQPDFLKSTLFGNDFLFELIYINNIYANPHLCIASEDSESIENYFNLLYREYTHPKPNALAIQSLLYLTLAEIQRLLPPQTKEHIPTNRLLMYKKFVEVLENNYNKNLKIKEYADRLHITPKTLSRLIHEVTNHNFTDVVQHRVILEAKRMLQFSNLSISQIADDLGYDDASYFSRCFKKIANMTPLEFRQNLS